MKRKSSLLLSMAAFLAVIACGCSSDNDLSVAQEAATEADVSAEIQTETPTEAPTELQTEAPKNDERITLEEYNQIQTGMTYDEVVSIVGSSGTETATSSVAGYTMSMISWDGNGYIGSNANVTFSNGTVSAKAQFGLQ